MLTVGSTADTGESVTLYDALETLSFRSTNNINESDRVSDDIGQRYSVAEFEILCEIGRELDEFAHRFGPCLFEMPLERRAGVLFCSFVIGKLYSGITIFFYCTYLRNNTRPSFDDSAWQIFAISTENGSHSDFLSN